MDEQNIEVLLTEKTKTAITAADICNIKNERIIINKREMKFETASFTFVGNREDNEDSFSVSIYNGAVLCTVADGVGGALDGARASQMAVSSLNRFCKEKQPDEKNMIVSISSANQAIFQWHKEHHSNLATTIAVVWADEYRAIMANAGDSRIYLFRNGRIISRSKDHSLAQLLVDLRIIKPENIRVTEAREFVTKALGPRRRIKPDVWKHQIEPGDIFLICSDGVWEHIYEDEMIRECSKAPEECISGLKEILKARDNGNMDNQTCVCITVL